MLNFKIHKQKIYDNEIYGEIEIYFDYEKKIYTVDFITHFVNELKSVIANFRFNNKYLFCFYEDDGRLLFKKEKENSFSLYYGKESEKGFLVDTVICENEDIKILNDAILLLIEDYNKLSI